MDEQKTNECNPEIHAMEIWVADIPRQPEGGPYGRRPVVILSIDNVGERTEFAPVIPLSSDLSFPQRSSHALLHADCLKQESRALCEHMTLLHKKRLVRCIGRVGNLREQIALYVALGHHLNMLPQGRLPVRTRVGRKGILPDSTLNVLRRWNGLTRPELAQLTGISMREIESFERGRRSMMMPDVMKLACYFGVSITCLLDNRFDELEHLGVKS